MSHTIACRIVLLVTFAPAAADDPRPPELTPDERRLAATAKGLDDEASRLMEQGKPAEVVAKLEQALQIRRQLYPASKYPDGQIDLATNLNNLVFALGQAGAVGAARRYQLESLAMHRKLYPASKYPDGHEHLVNSLGNTGAVLQMAGAFEEALPYVEEALGMSRKLYPPAKHPDGHPVVARALNNLGTLLLSMGAAEQARPHLEEALAAYRRLFPESKYPAGDPELAQVISNIGGLFENLGQNDQSVRAYEDAWRMYQKLFPEARFPDGHPALANSVLLLGFAWVRAGSPVKALPYCEQALAALRRLYPEARYPAGHPDLALSLEYLATALQTIGLPDKAEGYYGQALAMYRRLYPPASYPDGHHDIANSLNNMASILLARELPEQSRPYAEQALAMRRRLLPAARYPNGHPVIVRALSTLGAVCEQLRRPDQAIAYHEEALAIRRKLYPASRYPDGHLDLAHGLGNLASALMTSGDATRAFELCLAALAMEERLDRRFLMTASEADALTRVLIQPRTLDGCLSAALQVANSDPAAYRPAWERKAGVGRALEQRLANARAVGAGRGPDLDRLRAIRRRTGQLLQGSPLPAAERDRLLAALAEERDRLERRLADAVPALSPLNRGGPDDLRAALPPDAAFIDLVAYTHFESTADADGGRARRTSRRYAAFVVTRERVRRVELGEAEPINAAVTRWRRLIDERADDRAAARDVAARVWAKLAPALPRGAAALHISPVGDLARVPWAALPTADGRVLLEDVRLSTVPHGPFLLDRLRASAAAQESTAALLVGGLEYGASRWRPLPGAAREVAAVSALAPAAPVLSKADASAARLTERLPQARYVHLATHGEFRAEEFAAERRLENDALKAWREGMGDARRVAAQNPLGFVGLVLSGGEVLSGLTIVDLNLSGVRLVTLSACETGLGEYTAGKGVESIQMAFHLAGCPNVVASLWRVDDAATAALMAKFYHELWVGKKPPLDALRAAQLAIYRHPELIPDLAGERGAPRLKAAAAGTTSEPPASATGEPPASAGGGRRAATRLWAAFVLSGAGR